jgi:TRAP-type C4-dicarboxylate transport system permease small subunit
VKTWIIVVALLALLGLAAWAGYRMWTMLAGAEISGHGWLAMALGIVFAFLVGGGLMALLFYSSRHGYDEAADFRMYRSEDDEEPR